MKQIQLSNSDNANKEKTCEHPNIGFSVFRLDIYFLVLRPNTRFVVLQQNTSYTVFRLDTNIVV